MDKKITGIKTTSIHERIKLLRTQNKMTLQDVAEAMGRGPEYRTAVWRWENGSKPSYENIMKLSKVFNASVEWLMNGEEE